MATCPPPWAPPGSALPGRGALPLPPRSELSEGEGPCVRAPFPSRGSPADSPFVAGTTGARAPRGGGGGGGGRRGGPGPGGAEGEEGGGGASASRGDAGGTAGTGGVGIVRGEGAGGAGRGGGSWGGIARRARGDSKPGIPDLSAGLAG